MNKRWSELTEQQREHRRQSSRLYYSKHREQCLEAHKKRKRASAHLWPSCSKEYQLEAAMKSYHKMQTQPERKERYLAKKREWNALERTTNNERVRVRWRDWYAKLKREVMNAYGGKCTCCEESEIAFLTIDHVNGDGAERRRNGEPYGGTLYAKLKRMGYPSDYQPLCWNCNLAKHQLGECPHKSKTGALV